jgi:bifunctional non-homologous end joining protein LigD
MTGVPRFIPPCSPVLGDAPPTGPGWVHEVKFDGWRLQVHRRGQDVRLYSRNGRDLTHRFAELRDHLLTLPDCIIDAELVACDTDGKPDFEALMRKDPNLCVWCFDLLEIDGADLRARPLMERKDRLREMLIAADDDRLRYSEVFADPVKLLAVVEKMGLEGVFRSGPTLPIAPVRRRTGSRSRRMVGERQTPIAGNTCSAARRSTLAALETLGPGSCAVA